MPNRLQQMKIEELELRLENVLDGMLKKPEYKVGQEYYFVDHVNDIQKVSNLTNYYIIKVVTVDIQNSKLLVERIHSIHEERIVVDFKSFSKQSILHKDLSENQNNSTLVDVIFNETWIDKLYNRYCKWIGRNVFTDDEIV